MLDPAPQLRRTPAVDAANRNLSLVLHYEAAALRTIFRHPEFLLGAGAKVSSHPDHGGNYFARLFNDDDIANPNVFPFDFFFVVQGCPRYSTAADRYRFERRHRGQCTSAADLDQNILQPRFDPLGFILERDGPAR